MIYDLLPCDSEMLKKSPDPFVFGGDIDPEELASNMFESMTHHNGLGLSANQVGINTRMFVIGYDKVKFAVFNPEIVAILGKDTLMPEGCLSFPYTFINVKRPGSIHVRFQDTSGKVVEEVFYGLTARIFLHEYDHMQGITMDQRVSKMKWDLAQKRKTKLKRRYDNGSSKQMGIADAYS